VIDDAKRAEWRRLADEATPGPWCSARDGNQYIETSYLPTAQLVGASRIEEIRRPWNPHAYVSFGITAEDHETARFLDADADFIAQPARQSPPCWTRSRGFATRTSSSFSRSAFCARNLNIP